MQAKILPVTKSTPSSPSVRKVRGLLEAMPGVGEKAGEKKRGGYSEREEKRIVFIGEK